MSTLRGAAPRAAPSHKRCPQRRWHALRVLPGSSSQFRNLNTSSIDGPRPGFQAGAVVKPPSTVTPASPPSPAATRQAQEELESAVQRVCQRLELDVEGARAQVQLLEVSPARRLSCSVHGTNQPPTQLVGRAAGPPTELDPLL
jgi:hypothetical protein